MRTIVKVTVSVLCDREVWETSLATLKSNGVLPVSTYVEWQHLGSSSFLSCGAVASMAKGFARFSAFARGRIVGKAAVGASRGRIRKEVLKKELGGPSGSAANWVLRTGF